MSTSTESFLGHAISISSGASVHPANNHSVASVAIQRSQQLWSNANATVLLDARDVPAHVFKNENQKGFKTRFFKLKGKIEREVINSMEKRPSLK